MPKEIKIKKQPPHKKASKHDVEKMKNEPMPIMTSDRRAAKLHSQAGLVYLSILSQNLTKSQIEEFCKEEYEPKQTVIERLAIQELNDALKNKDDRKFVLSLLSKQIGGPVQPQEKKDDGGSSLFDDLVNTAIVEGEIIPDVSSLETEQNTNKK